MSSIGEFAARNWMQGSNRGGGGGWEEEEGGVYFLRAAKNLSSSFRHIETEKSCSCIGENGGCLEPLRGTRWDRQNC